MGSTYQCVEVASDVVHGLIRQILALVNVISTVEYYFRFRRKSADDDQGCGDEPDGRRTEGKPPNNSVATVAVESLWISAC